VQQGCSGQLLQIGPALRNEDQNPNAGTAPSRTGQNRKSPVQVAVAPQHRTRIGSGGLPCNAVEFPQFPGIFKTFACNFAPRRKM
jgi:hypothetical protein